MSETDSSTDQAVVTYDDLDKLGAATSDDRLGAILPAQFELPGSLVQPVIDKVLDALKVPPMLRVWLPNLSRYTLVLNVSLKAE